MADNFEKPSMSAEVAGAVVAVMSSLGTLAKGNENKFDKYDYASIDDFIVFVREHCHAAGLFIIPHEADEPRLIETKKKDGTPIMQWWSRFAFTLAHKSGATYGPIYKTVMVQATGAQAAGSAQSYALKQLMRGLFLIPTGDKDDPDTKSTAEITTSGQRQTDIQQEATRIKRLIEKSSDLDALNLAWEDNAIRLGEIKAVSSAAYDHLSKTYDTRKQTMENV